MELRRKKMLIDMGFAPDLVDLLVKAEDMTRGARERVREIAIINQWRVMRAFHESGLSEGALAGTTGYGLGDEGREILEQSLAAIFGTEAALLRIQIVSGTHALTAALFGNLAPGKVMVSATGRPYDTLMPVIGYPYVVEGSLRAWGVGYRQLELTESGQIDLEGLGGVLDEKVGVVFLQRSRGYTCRSSFGVEVLAKAIERIKSILPEAVVIVDNCYGELVETIEPTHAGADLVAGSLIKNLGGTVAPAGGYLAGTKRCIERAAARLTAPGIAAEEGPTLGFTRLLAQGLWFAPMIVGQALEGMIWASCFLELCGYDVSPKWDEPRTDIIQAVYLDDEKAQQAFCRGVQQAGPVDHTAVPYPVIQPGYRDPIIMAGGTFIQGASLELSADGPIRSPYVCYLQGGISLAQVQVGILYALAELRRTI